MTKNIRYRGAVQPMPEFVNAANQRKKDADRDYKGTYRGAAFHHQHGEDAAQHKAKPVDIIYRGAKGVAMVG